MLYRFTNRNRRPTRRRRLPTPMAYSFHTTLRPVTSASPAHHRPRRASKTTRGRRRRGRTGANPG